MVSVERYDRNAKPFEIVDGAVRASVVGHDHIRYIRIGIVQYARQELFQKIHAVPVEYYYRNFRTHMVISPVNLDPSSCMADSLTGTTELASSGRISGNSTRR